MSKSAEWTSSSTHVRKPMGPAPIASFEDLSDEVRTRLESPEEKNVSGSVVRLPGIREDLSPASPVYNSQQTKKISLIGRPISPISKNVKHQTPRIDISRASSSSHHDSKDSSPDREMYDANGAKLGLGFKEDGALDLRSSTEELDFQDISISGRKRPQSPSTLDDPITTRKDSQCSDIVLLSISGRTSRLSSIGSQGSNQSRISNISHISILSGQSNLSRCSSPHKMQLETSFCGTKVLDKPAKENRIVEAKIDTDVMEKILLSRKHDPTEAIFAEGISVDKVQTPDTERRKEDVTKNREIPKITSTDTSSPRKNVKSRFVSESGVEYYYIPLKGPLPPDLPNTQKVQYVKKTQRSHHQTESEVKTKKTEPKYIRIKLKPDKSYPDKDISSVNGTTEKIDVAEENEIISSSPSINTKLELSNVSKRMKPGEKKEEENISLKSVSSTLSTESIDKKSKSKSVLSLFKSKKLDKNNTKAQNHNENGNIKQSYYENPLQCATIRIPLHSPTYYENRSITTCEITENVPKPALTSRQNSTSSENMTFSTNLGTENEIFTTKLPKTKQPVVVQDENTEEKMDIQENKDINQELEQNASYPNENLLDNDVIEDKSVASICSTADDHNSSESERDIENKNNLILNTQLICETEKQAIVFSQDSFEDELPYVPTTLPLERSAALPILPINKRSILEIKTCPIERPRSSTPLNPSCLNEYCEDFSKKITKNTEKIKILLPRNDSIDKINKGRDSNIIKANETPPPLPPKGVHWISFDDIPEKRKIPKRIQTLPSHSYADENAQECVIYNYVNPEECKCECHELSAKKKETEEPSRKYTEDDELPLLEDDYQDETKFMATCKVPDESGDCTNILSDSTSNNQRVITETASSFLSELPLTSNTSCITSQDDYQSPVSPYLPRIY
ncbi:uncharacterized protein LOC130446945 isoform X1 [Diorhabda sublineata]|uniref:uncharacterized protein LOC130446945 isoform X1 n=1 Tax=Diorhabda sublineata TaxID=1163346 RepID=UPI0024E18989|nr:uncharacterized protein LOC130446945 isoform X1 [Diorhabda sublineata]XP_056639477.1 uncharacterized protein LOC130446945 isoform X1 [Diorhabda sublineata]